ncbi:TPA: nucleoside recognition domain-containing protein, partial [Clostridioides difficile]|nr:nucleoside recognition domain-containing protein [Clostridioides difficile]
VKEAGIAASAIMSGLADNYLPVIIGGSIQAASTKVIVAMMSILSIIYLSETATLLSSTKIIKKFWQTILIFLERTYIALPFVILFVKVFM